MESLVALYRVGTHQIWRGRRAARSLTSQGSAERLCARIKGVNREVSEAKSDLCSRSVFLPTRANKERRTGKIRVVFFRDAQDFGRLGAGSRAGFASCSRPPPPWTSAFQFSLFLQDVWP